MLSVEEIDRHVSTSGERQAMGKTDRSSHAPGVCNGIGGLGVCNGIGGCSLKGPDEARQNAAPAPAPPEVRGQNPQLNSMPEEPWS